jgi:hypothetical protein
MSKRTNAFQKAILFIHEQLKGPDTYVYESCLLQEANIDKRIDREIDVLIEKIEGGTIKRVAIECRDRFVKDDIIWIDGLIGKYLNLPVDKLIAVSSSGFSEAAKLKAKANGIELRTTKEIKNINWDQEFIKIGMVDWQLNFQLLKVTGETKDGHIMLNPEDKVTYKDEIRTFSELFQVFREALWDKLFTEKFSQKIKETYKTKEDLSKFISIEYNVPIPNFQLIKDKSVYSIESLTLHIVGTPTVINILTRHYNYLSSVISRTELKVDENQSLIFFTTQAGPNEKLGISIDNRFKKNRIKSI